jgi:pilus assembly protein CpaC
MAADRVMAIVATLAGKGGSVNLLRVEVPPVEQQIMLKVRFCNVERTLQTDLGLGLASGAFNQATSIGTGQYSTPSIDNNTGLVSIANALNIMMFRKDINLAATIKALEARSLLETLAEPNLLAINGKEASFVAGGEFPFPMIQPGIGGNTVTIAFREFGIRIKFLPRVTTRGTIQLQVAPEVSSLDYGHLVNVSGTSIPAMATRRVQTEVELESGQSFVIGGLMDNSLTETISKIPGLANIPLLGKLFTSRSYQRNNSELLVIVTPELVRPIPAGQPLPALTMKGPFLPRNSDIDMHQPGIDKTGPVPVKPPVDSIPVEQLVQQRKEGQAAPQANPQFLIVQAPQALANPNPGLAPSPASGGTAK